MCASSAETAEGAGWGAGKQGVSASTLNSLCNTGKALYFVLAFLTSKMCGGERYLGSRTLSSLKFP